MKKENVESIYSQIAKGETKKARSNGDGLTGPATLTFYL